MYSKPSGLGGDKSMKQGRRPIRRKHSRQPPKRLPPTDKPPPLDWLQPLAQPTPTRRASNAARSETVEPILPPSDPANQAEGGAVSDAPVGPFHTDTSLGATTLAWQQQEDRGDVARDTADQKNKNIAAVEPQPSPPSSGDVAAFAGASAMLQ